MKGLQGKKWFFMARSPSRAEMFSEELTNREEIVNCGSRFPKTQNKDWAVR